MPKWSQTQPQYKICSPQPQNSNPQTQESVTFQSLALYPWHSNRIPTGQACLNHNQHVICGLVITDSP